MIQRVSIESATEAEIEYPDDNGEPLAENVLQLSWIMMIQCGISTLLGERDDAFVAGDLLWYPIEGNKLINVAPDIMTVFGRAYDRMRTSYLQWEEGHITPQVTFEILSHSNRPATMLHKHIFYQRHGVEEYYIIDPRTTPERIVGYRRQGLFLVEIDPILGFTSPRLGVRFEVIDNRLQLIRPDGRPFPRTETLTPALYAEQALREAAEKQAQAEQALREAAEKQAQAEQTLREKAVQQAQAEQTLREAAEKQAQAEQTLREAAEKQAQAEQTLREAEQQRANTAEARAARLAELLRQQGIDPDTLEPTP